MSTTEIKEIKKKLDGLHPHAKEIAHDDELQNDFKSLISAVKRAENPDRKTKRKQDRETRTSNGIKKQRTEKQQKQQLLLEGGEPAKEDIKETNDQPIKLNMAIVCYICKLKTQEVHGFYTSMCNSCGKLNLQCRSRTANLSGKNVIVTGGRIKIGFEIVLKLLRSGANVTATTRYIKDAWVRFSQEKDFGEWKSRLHIDSLDLLNLAGITSFVERIRVRYKTVDVLINNAAQTLARDADFYQRERQRESQELLLLCPGVPAHALLTVDASTAIIPAPKETTLIKVTKVDEYGQPRVDSKSWIDRLEQVSTQELAEVTMINQIAPFILIQKLQPLMEKKSPDISWVANVTAMEGVFNKTHKSSGHPHTNMAKAALMMATRTSADDFWKRYRINMYSPDTGFIDQMRPTSDTIPDAILPLDAVDGAARVLNRIFMYYLDPKLPLTIGGWEKDYKIMDKW